MIGYTKEHAWVRADGRGGDATIGITDYAQRQLGDIVYVDLPKPGTQITQGQAMGTVESVKSVSELFAPVSGIVVETNALLEKSPEKLNQAAEGEAWMMKVTLADPSQLTGLLDAAAYAAFAKTGS